VADALAKANELARLNNVQVAQVLSVSEVVASGGGYYPGGAMAYEINQAKGGGGVGPITAGEMVITAQLQVVYTVQ